MEPNDTDNFTPNTANENAVVQWILDFYNASPVLFLLLAVVGFPEIEILAIVLIIVAALLP